MGIGSNSVQYMQKGIERVGTELAKSKSFSRYMVGKSLRLYSGLSHQRHFSLLLDETELDKSALSI
jgi:hypothetical protein